MRRIVATVAVTMVCAAGALGAYLVLVSTPGVTTDNCKSLYVGMSLADVETVFGRPSDDARDYRKEPLFGSVVPPSTWRRSSDGSDIIVVVYFEEDDKVSGAFWRLPEDSKIIGRCKENLPLLARWRMRLGLLGWK